MDGVIYLDYNATTPLAPEVIETIKNSLNNAWANPSSSTILGKHAKEIVNKARDQVARMIGASSNDILFTSGGTEANNLVLHSVVKNYTANSSGVETGRPHIITTTVEHDAILLPLKNFEREGTAEVTYVPVSQETGLVSSRDIVSAINPNTCLITVMLANNETGAIMPVAEIIKELTEINKERTNKIFFHTDAAQAIGKIPVDVNQLNVDYLTVVGHKFYGPRISALYVKSLGTETPLHPMFFGGGQERGYRPGTENTPMIAGLGTAADLVTKNLESYNKHMQEIRDCLEQKLLESFGDKVTINCAKADRLPNTSNISLAFGELTGGEILAKCEGLLASTGAACHGTAKPSAILLASGVPLERARRAIRFSVGRDTTKQEIDAAIKKLESVTMF